MNENNINNWTPEPWTIGSGSHVCGSWGGMIRIESPEDFHNNGHDYPDGGSTRSYTNVVCGTTGHSDTALANVRRIIACVNACTGMSDPSAEIKAMREAIQAAVSVRDRLADRLSVYWTDGESLDLDAKLKSIAALKAEGEVKS